MATVIAGSPDITLLDSRITADLCGGNFILDLFPSVFVGGRQDDVSGVQIKIINPLGVIIKNYLAAGAVDIANTGTYTLPVPLVALNYLYGNYTFEIKVTDSAGTVHTDTKIVNICPVDKNNSAKKVGCIKAVMKAKCTAPTNLAIILNNPSTYRGLISTDQVNTIQVKFPTASQIPPYNTALSSFSVTLFNGVYNVSGHVCATYAGANNIIYKVKFLVECEKKVSCILDDCCIQAKLVELRLKSKSDCTQGEKDDTASKILGALFLWQLAKGAIECEDDPSEFITELEDLLGCSCTCNCDGSIPV